MTEAHKAALVAGRAQGKAVRDYLEALESNKPRRGRKRTPETIQAQINATESALADASPLNRLKLIQQRIDLLAAMEALSAPPVDLDALEAKFVEVAAAYGKSQGISYAAWREVGVDPAVLKKAGVGRGA